MSELKGALGLLLDTMNDYGTEDYDNILTKKELVELINTEFQDAPKENPEVEDLFSQLASDRGDVVTFSEFITIVADFDKIYTNSSRLTQAMEILKETFKKYARLKGDSDTLIKSELDYMLFREFPNAFVQRRVDNAFSEMDANDDGVVSFEEFLTTVADIYIRINFE